MGNGGGRSTLNGLQVLRFIAALLVVLRHSSARVAEVYPHAGWFDWTMGSVGVNIFFVISGFIMVHVTDEKTTTPLDFWSRRLLRIVPLYWVCTGIAFIGGILAPLYFFGASTLQDLATSLFFVPDLLPRGKLSPILIVGWTLNLEMPFYMLMAACLVFRRSYLLATVGALFTVFLLASSLTSLGYFPRFYTVNGVWLEFALGIFLAVLLQRSSAIPAWVGIVSAAIGFAFIAWLWRAHKVPADELINGGLPACLIVGGFIVAEPYFQRRWLRPLILLGDASYAIYVAHLLLLNPLARSGFDNPAGPLATIGQWGFFAVLLCSGVGLGLLTHLYFERPVARLLRPLLGRGRRATAALARPTLAIVPAMAEVEPNVVAAPDPHAGPRSVGTIPRDRARRTPPSPASG